MRHFRILFLILVIVIFGCGGSGRKDNTANGDVDNNPVVNNDDSTVNNNDNSNDGAVDDSTVENQPPQASFSVAPDNEPAPVEIQFDASASVDPDGAIVSYDWDFGDGQIGTGSVVTHRYSAAGGYAVTLTLRDDDGATVTVIQNVTITAKSPYSTLSGTVKIPAGVTVDNDVNDINSTYTSNDSLASAQEISNPAAVGGYVNVALSGHFGRSFFPGDRADFYKVSLLGNESIMLQIADASSADLDLYLYDDKDEMVDSSQGVTDVETLTVSQAGIYYIEVLAYKGASNYVFNLGHNLGNGSTAQLRLGADFVPGQVLVRFAPPNKLGSFAKQVLSSADDYGLHMLAGDQDRPVLFELRDLNRFQKRISALSTADKALDDQHKSHMTAAQKEKYDTLQMIKSLRSQSDIKNAEPNYWRHFNSITPNDQYYHLQWHYPLIGLPQAWEVTTGNSDVITAVVDTGVLLNHPDLAGQLVQGFDFISDLDNSMDGDGIDDDPDDPGDQAFNGISSFHGTHVAGTIAARSAYSGNSGAAGVCGVAGGTRVMPLRILGHLGGTSYDIVQAIRYAAGLSNDSGTKLDKPVDIINLSLGGPGYSQIEANAFAMARDAGVIVVAAGGNESSSVPSYPAAYDGVIAVSAVNIEKHLAGYSNHGSWVDVAAPGGEADTDLNGDGYADGVLSTMGDDSGGTIQYIYTFEQGTSMACPHVAGVAALMKSVYSSLTPAIFDSMLQGGELTEDIGTAGRDDQFGYGLIDANQAVLAAQARAGTATEPKAPILIASPTSLNFGQILDTLTLSVRNGGEGDLTLSSLASNQSWITIEPVDTDSNNLGEYLIHTDRSGLTEGVYQGVLSLTSSANTITLPVRMQVVDVAAQLNAGYHYILLIDHESGEVVDQVAATAVNGQYTFTFTKVLAGTYEIYAGTDNDNDLFIGDSGEALGAYRTTDMPETITVDGDISGLDFYTGYPSILSAQSVSNRNVILQRQTIKRALSP